MHFSVSSCRNVITFSLTAFYSIIGLAITSQVAHTTCWLLKMYMIPDILGIPMSLKVMENVPVEFNLDILKKANNELQLTVSDRSFNNPKKSPKKPPLHTQLNDDVMDTWQCVCCPYIHLYFCTTVTWKVYRLSSHCNRYIIGTRKEVQCCCILYSIYIFPMMFQMWSVFYPNGVIEYVTCVIRFFCFIYIWWDVPHLTYKCSAQDRIACWRGQFCILPV